MKRQHIDTNGKHIEKVFCMLFLCVLILMPLSAQIKSAKRGIAYGHLSEADMSTISKSLSWWYNWFNAPESGVSGVFQNYQMDFVPMAWGSTFDETAIRNYYSSHPNSKYLLGFNEPNFTNQSNLTPTQAAALWPKLEKIAADFDLEIVGPAVNYCDKCVIENGVTYSTPTAYLDAFFAACPNCKVDYIAVHNYMCYSGALSSYIDQFKKYKKPIWLTEFACWDQPTITLDMQKSYIMGALDYLENEPSIFRYAWFTGDRSGAYPYLDLFKPQSGELTELGDLYMNYFPTHDTSAYVQIPARIEAENYNAMGGVAIEACKDVDGLADVGWIDADDWMEYNIEVTDPGDYDVFVRIASNDNTSLQIKEKNTVLGSLVIPTSGGYQNWKTISTKINLTAGKHKLVLYTPTGKFNLNWISITQNSTNGIKDVKAGFALFPNPVTDKLHITNTTPVSKTTVVTLLDQVGRIRQSKTFSYGTVTMDVDCSNLENGLFILQVRDDTGLSSFPVIKQ